MDNQNNNTETIIQNPKSAGTLERLREYINESAKIGKNEKILKKLMRASIETLVIDFTIFMVFFILNPMREGFISMNIHPFIIVAAMVGFTYGNYSAVFTAVIHTIFYVIAYAALGKDIYLFFVDFAYYKFILMFFMFGIIPGRVRDKHVEREKKLWEENINLKSTNKELSEENAKLFHVKEELSKQIINTESSILSLYEVASAIEKLDSEEIFTELMGVVKRFINAETISFYTINTYESFLRLKIRYGEDAMLPNSIELNKYADIKHSIISRKVGRRGRYSEENTPALFAPIVANEKVIGVLFVENIQFTDINEYIFRVFSLIVEWSSKAIEKAFMWNEAAEGKLKTSYYPGTNIMTIEEFDNRVEHERLRKEKYSMNYVHLKYRYSVGDYSEIELKLKGTVRDVDIIGYDSKENELNILLPATGAEFKNIVQERILMKLEYNAELIA